MVFLVSLSVNFLKSNLVILRRYLTRQVASTTILVLSFLVIMLLGGRLIRYFGMAAEGGLRVDFLLSLIGYNLPYFLELILPLSFFIALMLVFGRLYTDSEMAVLNASGISRSSLGTLLFPLILFVFLAQAGLTLFAKPWGVRSADGIWHKQSVAQVFDLIRPKEFISSGDYHLYVGEIGQERAYLADVIIIKTDKNQQKDLLIFAKQASQVPSNDSTIQLDLHQGQRYELSPNSKAYNQVGFESYRVSLDIKKDGTHNSKFEGQRTSDLLASLDNKALGELGYRFSLPWLIWLAVVMALPLSKVSPRQGRWLKLVPAILLYVVAVLLVISLKDPITKGKVGIWAYPVLLVLMFALAIYANYHSHLMTKKRLSKGKTL